MNNNFKTKLLFDELSESNGQALVFFLLIKSAFKIRFVLNFEKIYKI